jgi:hypothetical protein
MALSYQLTTLKTTDNSIKRLLKMHDVRRKRIEENEANHESDSDNGPDACIIAIADANAHLCICKPGDAGSKKDREQQVHTAIVSSLRLYRLRISTLTG